MNWKKLAEAAKRYEERMKLKKEVSISKKEIEPVKVQKMQTRKSSGIEYSTLSKIIRKVGEFIVKGEKKKKKKTKGIDIPKIPVSKVEMKKGEEIDLTKIDIVYPLTPPKPKEGEEIYAYAHIRWNPNKNVLIYEVVEPILSKADKELLEKIKKIMQERLDVDFTKLNLKGAKKYIDKRLEEIIEMLGVYLTGKRKKIIKYYLYRDFIGLGKIEPLMHDPYIEDISCDGVGIPIYVYHRNPYIASVETNIIFESKEELDNYIMKLAQKAEKSISMAEPLVDASLPDGSRIQLTLGTDIARKGSNFTIRKFTEKPLTPIDLMNFGTVDSKILAYLWYCIENGKSILISGGTATGKTTFLNVLSMFIRPNLKIVSIEDTPELRFSHPHWVPEVARSPLSETGEKKYGQVDLYDLLRESLRQRPDYIIVGEVRGKETYVLFQQMATGHPGLSTIHAETIDKLMNRLRTEPINLPPSLIETLDIIIFLSRIKRKDKYVRRVKEILEMERYDIKNEKAITNKVFEWDPVSDTFNSYGSIILEKISKQTGTPENKIKKDIENRIKILEGLRKMNITDYRMFGKFIRMYYVEPEKLLEAVRRVVENE